MKKSSYCIGGGSVWTYWRLCWTWRRELRNCSWPILWHWNHRIDTFQKVYLFYSLSSHCRALQPDIMFIFCPFCFTRAKHVYGYEIVPQAISDACRNAELNGITNATFVQGDLNKVGESFGNNFPKPDVVISGYFCSTSSFFPLNV